MPLVILFIAGAVIVVVWLAVRNSPGTGHPSDRPRTDMGIGADGHTLHHHYSDDGSSHGNDGSGDSGSGDSGGGDCGGGGDGGGGGGSD